MGTKRRVDNLHSEMKDRWRSAWKDFGMQVAYMFTRQEATACYRLMNIRRGAREREEEWLKVRDAIDELADDEWPPGWEEWMDGVQQVISAPPMQSTPADLPDPPEEPEGVWEEAQELFQRTQGYKRLAVMHTLWWLALARTTRQQHM